MQKIFISTIRFGFIIAFALSVFVGEAFAAPLLTPAYATAISDTTATLVAKASNPGYTTTTWFEWGETPTPTTAIGMRDISGEGFFQGYLNGLKAGTTYYFRAVAMEGGVTVYSPVVTFTTRGGAVPTPSTSSVQANSVVTGGPAQTTSTTNVPTTPTSQITTVSPTITKAPTPVTKKTVVQKTSNIKNDNTAAVSNGASTLPGTLIGWVSFLIGLLIAFIIVAMIIDSAGERRKAREEKKKKKLERENEEE